MTTERAGPLEPTQNPSKLLEQWNEQQLLPQAAYTRALQLLRAGGVTPSTWNWRTFIETALLLLGSAFFLAGVIFFFAYNWASMHRFVKFGLIQGSILVALLSAYKLGLDQLSGKASLLAGAVLIGPLLAVFGQTYQTGADPYQLFLGWAVLSFGFVLISQFAAAWFFLCVLVNLTIPLYLMQEWGLSGDSPAVLYALFFLNALCLVTWECGADLKTPLTATSAPDEADKAAPTFGGIAWLQTMGRWAPRALFLMAFLPLTVGTNIAIHMRRISSFEDQIYALMPVLYLIGLGAAWFIYQKVKTDLFILAAGVLSILVTSCSFALKLLPKGLDGFFVLSLLAIAETTVAAYWLRKVHQHAKQ